MIWTLRLRSSLRYIWCPNTRIPGRRGAVRILHTLRLSLPFQSFKLGKKTVSRHFKHLGIYHTDNCNNNQTYGIFRILAIQQFSKCLLLGIIDHFPQGLIVYLRNFWRRHPKFWSPFLWTPRKTTQMTNMRSRMTISTNPQSLAQITYFCTETRRSLVLRIRWRRCESLDWCNRFG